MKKSAFFLLTAFIILSLCSVGYPHGTDTHLNITNQAITYLFHIDPLCFKSNYLYTNLDIGAVEEDSLTPPRSLFHFYPRLDRPSVSADCDSIAWGLTSNPTCTAKIPRSLPIQLIQIENKHTWQNAIDDAGKDEGWIHLGYVLHLLQDLTSPAHVRNDPHPPWNSDPFENVTNGWAPAFPTGNLISLPSPVDYFINLQRSTQKNFFSADTCFDPSLPGPVAATEDLTYFYDSNVRKIARKGVRYWSNWPILDRRDATIDYTIASEQFAELGPQAVLYTASLIKHYHDQYSSCSTACSCSDGTLSIDPYLKAVMAGIYGPYVDPITQEPTGPPDVQISCSELEQMTQFGGIGLYDISGLQYCKNLTNLSLMGVYGDDSKKIRDLGPIACLVNLRELDLSENVFTDLRPLSGLVNLSELSLSWNGYIADLKPLAGLVNLTYLNLNITPQTADLGPLSGMKELIYLYLSGQHLFTDLRPLSGLVKLRELWLNGNPQITDVGPLAGLVNLTTLWLGQTQIRDLGPLSGMVNLRQLGLPSQISDLGPLSGMRNLTDLYASNNQISDLRPLSGLVNLSYVDLSNNNISDLGPLLNNPGLGSVYVFGNPLSEQSIKEYIPKLRARGVYVAY